MASKKSSIDQELIRNLASLLTETDLTEIEIEQDDFRIRVARNISTQPVHVSAPTPVAAAPAVAPAAETASERPILRSIRVPCPRLW